MVPIALISNQNCGAWHNVGVNITQGFHTYGVDVEPTGITYFFDGSPYASCPANSAVNKPLYMIVNLAVGGVGSWPGTPNSSNVWPAYLYVDYVRAYQTK
jgi:beta-glucanase (GH16 family)